MKSEIKSASEYLETEISRRGLLKWAPPTVAMVALPVHAQTSICTSLLVAEATAPSKCSGTPPVGQAVIRLTSDAMDPNNPDLDILSITVNGAAASDTVTFPSLPMSVTDTLGLDISWTGNGSDALTCLPLSTITFDITYRCSLSSITMVQSFDLTTLLADAIP